jgi:hypothetical protein
MRVPVLLMTAAVCAATLVAATPDEALGAPLVVKEQTPIADLLAKPAKFVGRSVQVKGKITAVCQMMGCWMELKDEASGASIRIKVHDGEIVFPKDSAGKLGVAEGTFTEIKMTREQAVAQARHEAEENKRSFDPASIKGPVTRYQIQATGAVIAQ